MKSFWKKYGRYRKELDEIYKMFGGSVAIQFKNVRQCMDEYTFESLCLYRWNRDPDDVSDEDVNCLFEADCLGSKVDIKIFLDKLKKDFKMAKSVTDGPSRVLCLARLFEKICTESGSPSTMKLSVRKKISTELRFSKKRYMVWKDFVYLCIDYMKTWCMYEAVFKSDTRPEAKPEARKKFDRPNQKPRVEKKQAESADTAAPGDAKAKASKPSYTCLKCQSVDHNVWKCPKLKDEAEAKSLLKAYYDAKRAAEPKKPNVDSLLSATGSDFIQVVCAGLEMKVFFDSGADVCVISRDFVRRATASGSTLHVKPLQALVTALAFNGTPVVIRDGVKIDLSIPTNAGPIVMTNLRCWVQDDDLLPGCADLLVSKSVMRQLGFDQQTFLLNAQSIRPVWDFEPEYDPTTGQRLVGSLRVNAHDDLIHDGDEMCLPRPQPLDQQKIHVRNILDGKLEVAWQNGMDPVAHAKLTSLLTKFEDVFRIEIGRDPPVKVPPMVVKLKPGATPVKCGARRYSLNHREFMKTHMEELCEAGLMYRNDSSAWASPPYIVAKPGTNKYRMTVDVRSVNSRTEPVQWPMPVIEVVMENLAGSTCFVALDFFKGYWQFPLDPSCCDLYTIMTDLGCYTSNRIPTGGSGSVAYCQATVTNMFKSLLYKCSWFGSTTCLCMPKRIQIL
ncbi:hypothetical protein Ae201684_015612 [Aphanomyces euteiches]|uniref:Reverse transcriptase domain-containing protein n=1 Tax=Aphanomyces euteiches TaxID=100861 RepID=A0A6G0WFH7_9STRA|nr:hypothetical protein Ae201684_015612 [Aphanomyces euteiches]